MLLYFYVLFCLLHKVEHGALIPFLSYGSQFTVFLGLHDSISEQACMGFLRRQHLILCLPLAIACNAVFPEGFVLCLLSPPVQLLSFTIGKVERIC